LDSGCGTRTTGSKCTGNGIKASTLCGSVCAMGLLCRCILRNVVSMVFANGIYYNLVRKSDLSTKSVRNAIWYIYMMYISSQDGMYLVPSVIIDKKIRHHEGARNVD
jgi:hypothetical protein